MSRSFLFLTSSLQIPKMHLFWAFLHLSLEKLVFWDIKQQKQVNYPSPRHLRLFVSL